MFMFLLILFFQPVFGVETGQFKYYLDQLRDDTVEPCNNFYRHACSKNATLNFFNEYTTVRQQQLKNRTIFDDVSKYFVEFIEFSSDHKTVEKLYRNLQNQYLISCQNNSLEMFQNIVVEVFGNNQIEFPNSASCQVNFEKILELDEFEYQSNPNIIEQLEKILWFHRNREIVQVVKSFFEEIRVLAVEWIDKTPWVVKNNRTYNFEKFMQRLHLYHDALNFADNQTQEYLACQKNLEKLDITEQLTTQLCLIKVIKDVSEIVVKDSDAYTNPTGVIVFGTPFYFYAMLSHSFAAQFGVLGFPVGHELGHHLIQDDKDSEIFSNKSRKCIQNQFEKTCEIYGEASCNVYNAQFDDNGSDLISGRFSDVILTKTLGQLLHGFAGNYGNITNAQLFFYSQAFFFCHASPRYDGRTHAASNARINAVAAQSDIFKTAFGCSSSSKMVQSLNEKCYIFGDQAPETKTSGNNK